MCLRLCRRPRNIPPFWRRIDAGLPPLCAEDQRGGPRAVRRLRRLILAARRVPCLESGEGRLYVPLLHEKRARAELLAYTRENRPLPPPLPPAVHRNALLMLICLAGLAVWHGLIAHRADHWKTLGSLDVFRTAHLGEWWRCLTALTLHADAGHLLANVLFGAPFLIMLGRRIGIGPAWLLTLLAGGLGNACNALYRPFSHDSLGFSTALFAVVGILAALSAVRATGRGRILLPLAAGVGILASIGTGDVEGRVDYGAHVFGLLAGLVLGTAWGGLSGLRSEPALSRLWRIACGLGAGGLIVAAWCFALASPCRPFAQRPENGYEAFSKPGHAMPIRIPADLPARRALETENIFVMTEERALAQDIRPLEIVIVNLMPTKIATETQLLRVLGNTPIQVNITLLRTAEHVSANTPIRHLDRFYQTFEEISARRFDGMIVTGAPVELLEFDRVDYWGELSRIMAYAAEHIHTTLYICWAAQAALYHHYGVPKHELADKLSGVFSHRVLHPECSLFRGFDDVFPAPHSRHTEIRRADLEARPELQILAESDEAGVAVVQAHEGRQIFMTGHLEYDRDTLDKEFRRDADRGLNPCPPAHYYPQDDPERIPPMTWRAHGHLFYSNWLNYYVYQRTPYLLGDIGPDRSDGAPHG